MTNLIHTVASISINTTNTTLSSPHDDDSWFGLAGLLVVGASMFTYVFSKILCSVKRRGGRYSSVSTQTHITNLDNGVSSI